MNIDQLCGMGDYTKNTTTTPILKLKVMIIKYFENIIAL